MNRLIIIICLLILAILAVIQAPAFLIVSDAPVKSDAVVLFIGNDKGTREKEAKQLLQEGFAEYLIIPAYRQIKVLSHDGTLVKADLDLKLNTSNLTPRPQDGPNQRTNEPTNQGTSSPSSPNQRTNQLTNQHTSSNSSPNQSNQLNKPNQWNRFIEDTHQEAIIARAMMEQLGLRSAILVSSPYHMRRIQIIADRVFSNNPPFEKGGRGDLNTPAADYRLTFIPTRHEAPSDDLWLFDSHDRKFVLNEYAKIVWFLLYNPFV